MTLTQTERGYPPVIEHVGKPVTVRREMGKIANESLGKKLETNKLNF